MKHAALWAAALLLLLGAVAGGLLMPYATGLLYAGHLPHLAALDALRGSGRVLVDGLWSDPAAAYPRRARTDLPSAGGWWLTAAFLATVLIAGTVIVVRALDVRVRSTRLARRWFEFTGTRPTAWARPRDLAVLQVDRATPDRLMLGTIGRLRRKLAALPETHVALVAPTGSGKSSRFIIPWVLQADGCPVVVCSTKLDVVDATRAHRDKQGRVWVWDPFGPATAGWSPLAGCRSWDGALRRAKWIASALGDGEHAAARFWNGEAAKLLAPLLHAAALVDGSMCDVLGWLDRPETALAASEILQRAEAEAADGQLNAVLDLDDRNKGTTFMSAAHLVEAFRYPAVQASDRAEITPADFLDGRANTLYIVAPEDEQEMLAPLVVGMLAEIFAYRQRAVRLTGAEDLQTLYFLLDETANIAPIEQLPKYLSGVRGAKVRIVTVWQDHGQLRTRYREAEATVLSNSQVKVYLGPITDELTRRYVEGALGDERVAMTTETEFVARGDSTARSETFRPRATAQRLQQLEHGRALLIHTSLPAAVIDTTAWFDDPALTGKASARESANRGGSVSNIGPPARGAPGTGVTMRGPGRALTDAQDSELTEGLTDET